MSPAGSSAYVLDDSKEVVVDDGKEVAVDDGKEVLADAARRSIPDARRAPKPLARWAASGRSRIHQTWRKGVAKARGLSFSSRNARTASSSTRRDGLVAPYVPPGLSQHPPPRKLRSAVFGSFRVFRVPREN
ncbi:hypothetical protein PG994_009226 [Apiospora phragmitis]|uniref:Uncharacterized protein n=1 Tax=Apiospora phragmitis TaxID=2905665 RepID=A0ABR1UIP0_9PEZI